MLRSPPFLVQAVFRNISTKLSLHDRKFGAEKAEEWFTKGLKYDVFYNIIVMYLQLKLQIFNPRELSHGLF
jgi:hypothetical protein